MRAELIPETIRNNNIYRLRFNGNAEQYERGLNIIPLASCFDTSEGTRTTV
jgi:hypothetical protein